LFNGDHAVFADDFRHWHECEMPTAIEQCPNSGGQSGKHMLILRSSQLTHLGHSTDAAISTTLFEAKAVAAKAERPLAMPNQLGLCCGFLGATK
jgi:hypothetical protein